MRAIIGQLSWCLEKAKIRELPGALALLKGVPTGGSREGDKFAPLGSGSVKIPGQIDQKF